MSGTKWFSCLWRGGVCVCVCVRVHIFHMQPSSAWLCLTHRSFTEPHGQPRVRTGCSLNLSWACAWRQVSSRSAQSPGPQQSCCGSSVSHFPASSPKAFCLWTVCSKCHLWPRQQQQKCWPVSVVDSCFHLGSDCLWESRGKALEPGFQGDII